MKNLVLKVTSAPNQTVRQVMVDALKLAIDLDLVVEVTHKKLPFKVTAKDHNAEELAERFIMEYKRGFNLDPDKSNL